MRMSRNIFKSNLKVKKKLYFVATVIRMLRLLWFDDVLKRD